MNVTRRQALLGKECTEGEAICGSGVINDPASDWTPVTSGVPLGYVLRPVVFIMYISDIDVGLNNFISKFVNNKKIGNSLIEDRNG